jgi:hypothetical protein
MEFARSSRSKARRDFEGAPDRVRLRFVDDHPRVTSRFVLMPSLRLLISLLVVQLAFALPAHAQTAAAIDSLSMLAGAHGESDGIVYHRYRDLSDLSVDASAPVWRLRLSDGDPLFGDADRLPTVIDTLRIGVALVGAPADIVATRSIVRAGIYSTGMAPRLLATARITDDSLLFEGLAGDGIEAPDNGSMLVELRIKCPESAVVGDQIRFSVSSGDVVSARAGSSGIAIFEARQTRTTGNLNRIVTSGLRLVVSSAFPDSAAPGEPFGGAISIVDSADNVLRNLDDPVRALSGADAGVLSGSLAAGEREGEFLFDSLVYSIRNDSAAFSFIYPGADTLSIVMLFTGGAQTLPTVAHIRPGNGGRREIDGTGISLEARNLDGVFLVEKSESAPAGTEPLPAGVNRLLPRSFRLTELTASAVKGPFLLGLPIESIAGGAHPASIRILYRDDSAAAWDDPARSAESFDATHVYAMFDAPGEFGLGTNVDRAVPVTGLTLEGEAIDGGRARLRWRTKSEIDNRGFVLRRAESRNGRYVTVDSYRANPGLDGEGTSATGAAYEWIDRDPRLNTLREVWYLLVEVSFDGIETAHGPVAITIEPEPRGTTGLSSAVHPNPCRDHTILTVGGASDGVVNLTLYDPRGEVVLTEKSMIEGNRPHDLEIRTAELAAGIYRYRLTTPAGETSGTIVCLGR